MATIGTFKKTGNNEFNGEIVTLSLQARNVHIVPETSRSGDNAPSHRIYVGMWIMRSGSLCGAARCKAGFSALCRPRHSA
ncbi:uncharacterized protein (DUF736 family) [Bradyrhizobium elkanii]|nr:uncharacterized protein (DUF736 family) [Bradyrhizobium elkanii]